MLYERPVIVHLLKQTSFVADWVPNTEKTMDFARLVVYSSILRFGTKFGTQTWTTLSIVGTLSFLFGTVPALTSLNLSVG